MTRELHCLRYGEQEIQYEIVRRPRKTLEIAVEPDASVVIAAPEDATLDAIEAKLRKRAAWVTRQQRYFSQFLPRTPERRFVAGETHLYLGRQYRLKVVPHVQETVEDSHRRRGRTKRSTADIEVPRPRDRRRWSGYHRRSRVETKMHCVKLLGQRLMARDFDRQVAELHVRIAVLNGYTALGIPVTEAVG